MDIKNVFQMISLNRKLSITEKMPKTGEISINVNFAEPPKLIKFQGRDAALVYSTVNINFHPIADALLKGESLLVFSKKEKAKFEESLKKDEKMPSDVENRLMSTIARRAVLILVKSNVELGIPPPVPLPGY